MKHRHIAALVSLGAMLTLAGAASSYVSKTTYELHAASGVIITVADSDTAHGVEIGTRGGSIILNADEAKEL